HALFRRLVGTTDTTYWLPTGSGVQIITTLLHAQIISHRSCTPGSIPTQPVDGPEEMDLHERTEEIVFHSCQAQRAPEPSDHGRSWHPTPAHPGGSLLGSECWSRPVQAGTIRPILPMRDPRPARPDAVNGPMRIGSTSQHSQAHYVQVARSRIHRIDQAH